MALLKSKLETLAAPCPEKGRLELVHYGSRAYALEAIFGESPIPMDKSMWVYTPYGYDRGQKYNVLFLMHGGTDNEGYWFGQGRYRVDDTKKYTDHGNITASLVDHLIFEKKIDPLIIVAPSFDEEVEPYTKLGNRVDSYFASTRYFWLELRNEIMPYIQKHYATYAVSDSEESYRAAREHFAYAGASQGSITGLYSVMSHCMDRFAYIGCFSAGAIRYAFDGKNLSVELDQEKLSELCAAIEQTPPSFWYNGCGDDDQMYASHKETYDRMLEAQPSQLRANENCCFVTHAGGRHNYRTWSEDIYNVLYLFFQPRGRGNFEAEARKIVGAYDADRRKGEIVFYGASNFALWKEMERDLTPYPVQNHGFGGSTDRDLMFYADELLYPYEPKAVFFQTCSNDYVQIAGSDEEKIEQCMADKREMFARFHEMLPQSRFVVMSGLLLPGRAEYLDLTKEINRCLKALCDEVAYMTFVDASDMTCHGGQFRTDIFADDQNHLNRQGQLLWANAYIIPALKAIDKSV